jgi:hypothetical protein
MKFSLTENKLRQIVSESVKKVINEISSDLAHAAYLKADDLKRHKQAKRFSDYANQQLSNEIGIRGSIIKMGRREIFYKSHKGLTVELNVTGYFSHEPDNCYNIWAPECEICPEKYKTDPATARILAKWCQRFLPYLKRAHDWHYWVYDL